MKDQQKSIKWYAQQGASPYVWWKTAHELKLSANQVSVLAVQKMLFGMSMECLLKGILVILDMGFQKQLWGGTFQREMRGHKLRVLADSVQGKDATLSISEEEREALDDLTAFIEWLGRYPVPLFEKEQSAISDTSNRKKHRNALWNRLELYLHKHGWVLKSDGSRHTMPKEFHSMRPPGEGVDAVKVL